MSFENARQRFQAAVGILVDEPGDVKSRLVIAFISQLSHVDQEHDLPKSLRTTFADVRFVLTNDEVEGDRGTISKEIEKLSDGEASQIARKIFNMFLALRDLG